jgi:hypothetical protein
VVAEGFMRAGVFFELKGGQDAGARFWNEAWNQGNGMDAIFLSDRYNTSTLARFDTVRGESIQPISPEQKIYPQTSLRLACGKTHDTGAGRRPFRSAVAGILMTMA